MFSKAYEIARDFTQPLIVSYRFFDNRVECGFGTCIILNEDGWLITAAHNLNGFILYDQHKKEIDAYEVKKQEILQNATSKEFQKRSALKQLKNDKNWITNHAFWVMADEVKIEEDFYYGEHDLAFIRIDKKYLPKINSYPKIKNPDNIKIGTSLCKLGFPFYDIKANFNEATKIFEFPPNTLPAPLFPIEGIFSRILDAGKTKDGSMDILYLETSSPGLKGQSGGPTFDINGNIWAIQSKNNTISLGFKGNVEIDGKKVEENQFINVGWGVHTKTIVELLKKHDIKFEMIE